jgi:hypothetical protein
LIDNYTSSVSTLTKEDKTDEEVKFFDLTKSSDPKKYEVSYL